MRSSMNDLAGDNAEKFFRRSLFDVSDADLLRWHVFRLALREMTPKPKE